jgi:hyperosmotically inducible periplasmic protein
MPRVRRIHSAVTIIGMTVSVITFFVSVPEPHAVSAALQVAAQDNEDAKRSNAKKAMSAIAASAEDNSTEMNVEMQNSADNTGKNVRDKSGATLTPMDQSNDQRDLDMTQKIRKALVADDSLSNNAKNIKVITVNGIVTLRGPVDSAEERKKIVAKAKSIANGKINNQLEIRSSK